MVTVLPEPSGDVDEARVRRRARAPIRDPWSAGVRVLWRSIEGSGRGGGLPPATGGGLPIVRGSCSAGGACSPNGDSQRAGALGGATSGNGLPVQGVAFDAGRLITAGVEVGMGLDLTTHPGEALLSTRPGVVFGNASSQDAALQVLTGERALQLDLAARLTYRPRIDDPGSVVTPATDTACSTFDSRPLMAFSAGLERVGTQRRAARPPAAALARDARSTPRRCATPAGGRRRPGPTPARPRRFPSRPLSWAEPRQPSSDSSGSSDSRFR